MKSLCLVLISTTAFLHLLFFKIESIDFMENEVLARFGLTQETGLYVKSWAFNQGFYNLFFAFGLFYCLFYLAREQKEKVNLLANFILLSIVAAGLVLAFSVPEKVIAAAIQAVPAFLALICLKRLKSSVT